MNKNKLKKKQTGKNVVTTSYPAKRKWFLLVCVLVITFVVFSPALKNDFTNWDDDLYVTKNTLIKSTPFENINRFGNNVVGNFHPVTMFSLAMDYHFFQLNPFFFHLKNLLLHLINTLLVFFLVQKITRNNLFVSSLTALAFGIHPMHVESVAWVAERKDVLYTFFFLTGLLLYYRYLSQKKIIWLLAASFSFVLSVLSKSAGVVFPVVLLLIDFYEGRKFNIRTVAEKIPLLLISLWIGIIAVKTQSQSNAIGDFEFYNLLERMQMAAFGFLTYLVKFIVPFKLSSFHPFPAKSQLPVAYTLSLIIAILLIIYLLLRGRKQKWLLFGAGFYFITVALVLQFFTVGNAIIAERYTYVPYIGIGIIWFMLIDRALHLQYFRNSKNLIYAILGLQLLFFAGTTWSRTKVWKNSESLWTDVIKKYPNESGAYSNRGHYFRSNNDYVRAIGDYNKAIELDKNNYRAISNRGKAYFDLGKTEQALADMNRTLEIKPNFAEGLSNRGAALASNGNFQSALTDLNKAIDIEPGNASAYSNRSLVYYSLNEFGKTIDDVTSYLRLEPDDPDMLNLRALSYSQLNKNVEALADFNRAIELLPSQGIFWQNRSFFFNKKGDKVSALRDIRKAAELGVKVNPEYIKAIEK
jgi:protein O-mannosyl-transferase